VTQFKNPDWQAVDAPEREKLPLSLLNDYFYCPRRAALKLVEGWREANEHTLRGDIVHEHTDLPGYEVAKGVLLWRALPVWSDRLGLSGKCDIVEVELDVNPKSEFGIPKLLRPVEFKLGKRRRWENDDAQLCAQALCLEEMFGIAVPRGAIFHADSRRRREVEFTAELRARTEAAVAELHALVTQSKISNLKSEIPRLPPAVWRPACEECSLFDVCLPRATAADSRAERLVRELFQI
jgi:CRISPR-associated exonuclease Cas4